MVQVNIVYEGDLHCQITHEPSGSVITTDAPLDNQGRGETFSPTDLVASALGSCIMTVLGIMARKENINLGGSRVTVAKEMVVSPIRRIGKLAVTVRVFSPLNDMQKQKFINAAHTCPVHKSLHPDVDAPIDFIWADGNSI